MVGAEPPLIADPGGGFGGGSPPALLSGGAKNDSMAALSPAPARPIEPTSPLFFSRRITCLERNWLPRPEWQIVPSGDRRAMALPGAEAPSVERI